MPNTSSSKRKTMTRRKKTTKRKTRRRNNLRNALHAAHPFRSGANAPHYWYRFYRGAVSAHPGNAPQSGKDQPARRFDRTSGAQTLGRVGVKQRDGVGLELFFGGWHLSPFHTQRGGRR